MQTSRTNDRYKTHRSSVKGEWPVVSMKTTKDHVRHLLTANKRDKKPSRFTERRKSYWNWRFVVSRRSVYGFIADWLDRRTIQKTKSSTTTERDRLMSIFISGAWTCHSYANFIGPRSYAPVFVSRLSEPNLFAGQLHFPGRRIGRQPPLSYVPTERTTSNFLLPVVTVSQTVADEY